MNFLASISLVEFSWVNCFVKFLLVQFPWRPRLGRRQVSKAESSSKTIQSQMKSASQHKGSIDYYKATNTKISLRWKEHQQHKGSFDYSKATKSSIWGKAKKECPLSSLLCEWLPVQISFKVEKREMKIWAQKRQTSILQHFAICIKSITKLQSIHLSTTSKN